MVYFQTSWLVIVGIVLTQIENGLSLRCWKCSSNYDSTCRDYFNTTRILLNQKYFDTYNYGNLQPARTEPHMTDCEGMHTSTLNQYKNVCLKRVIRVPNGLDMVTRECRMVTKNLKEGACPEEIAYAQNSNNIEFCGTCEYDGCNSASRHSLIFLGLVPAVLIYLLI